jgi:hypothetical protein
MSKHGNDQRLTVRALETGIEWRAFAELLCSVSQRVLLNLILQTIYVYCYYMVSPAHAWSKVKSNCPVSRS